MKYFIPLFLLSMACKPTSQVVTGSTNIYKSLIFEPADFDPESSYPLLIFLHGAGERGDDLEMLKVHGPPKLITEGREFPSYVLAPLCPKDIWWATENLEATLQDFLSKHNVDRNRIYLTGLSMGGYGTWKWACAHPDHFAAIAPICGGGIPENVGALKDIPIWNFHGAQDKVVPLSESDAMVDALKALDIPVKYTIYPEANHDSWTETYDNEDFWMWMFEQKKD